MSPSAVPHAARQGSQNEMEIVVTTTVSHAECFLPYAPSVAKTPKCLSSLPTAGPSIVEIATIRSNWLDNSGLTMDIHGPLIPARVCLENVAMCLNGVSIREGEFQVSLLCRFQKMMQMRGIVREAKSHRHFLAKN